MRVVTRLWPVTLLAAGVAAQGPAVSENVYFGDLHLHTRYSNDAAIFGTTRTPDDAYRYARGEAVRTWAASRSSSGPPSTSWP